MRRHRHLGQFGVLHLGGLDCELQAQRNIGSRRGLAVAARQQRRVGPKLWVYLEPIAHCLGADTPGGYGASLTSLSDLVQWAKACERVVQRSDEIVVDQVFARELKCDPGSRWVQVQSVRFDGGTGDEPVSWTDAYIDIRYAAALPSILEQPSVLISQLLKQQFGLDLAVVEQEVTGCKIDAHKALALKTISDSAGLKVARRYLTESGHPALITVSIHPADRFSLRTRLKRA